MLKKRRTQPLVTNQVEQFLLLAFGSKERKIVVQSQLSLNTSNALLFITCNTIIKATKCYVGLLQRNKDSVWFCMIFGHFNITFQLSPVFNQYPYELMTPMSMVSIPSAAYTQVPSALSLCKHPQSRSTSSPHSVLPFLHENIKSISEFNGKFGHQ